ncbi:M15 family metallopeptidase [Chelatococcus sambhunathii]|uniref:M15 family metallopeptidase n=1 Tax=Chelatococcus sambhunathii TaxID=363953 RepID=A0ABU1DKW4_9HYPH|nr:M15 family metallopeptidase [Chelatococcus sambhunathii]MDR4308757.1 M15 family metallopeptidase [Chelatococcus sambhunathii]
MSNVDTPNRDLSLLAPKFRSAIEAAIAECASNNLPVKINEGFRSQSRQAWLYAQGRTRPGDIVTRAPTSLTSWHGYGLAVDVVHATKAYWPFGRWEKRENEAWFAQVAAFFKKNGCNWGGDFSHPDTPHMQWGRCTPSPTQNARDIFRSQGVQAVWAKLSAA